MSPRACQGQAVAWGQWPSGLSLAKLQLCDKGLLRMGEGATKGRACVPDMVRPCPRVPA